MGTIFGCKTEPLLPMAEAVELFQKKKFAPAMEKFKVLAQQGNPQAQFYLGCMYYSGHGVPSNYPAAFEWFLKSAQQNQPESQYNLSQMYYNGQGVAKDDRQSLIWVMKAAKKGVPHAQLNLSARYLTGKGVKQDSSQTIYWLSKAADQGEPIANTRLGILYSRGNCGERDDKKALEHFQKAALQNEPFSQYLLARIQLQNGHRKEGLTLLFLSSKNGYVMADVAAGMLFLSYKQKEKAQKWFAKAEQQKALSADYMAKARKRGEELQNCKTNQERDRQIFTFIESLQPKDILDIENYYSPQY